MGKYDWHDFEYTVRAAVALAGDMGLSEEKVLLERALTRGSSSFASSAAQPFTDNLSSTRGLARG